MKIELIPESGKFYKANLHAHTDISDGEHTPEKVKRDYKAMGYSAVCFTDHEVMIAHNDLCDDEFVALHGYEVAIKKDLGCSTGYFMPVYHFNFIAKKQDNLKMPMFFENNPSMPGNSREWAKTHGQYDKSDVIDTTKYDQKWISDYVKTANDAGYLVTYNHPQWSLQDIDDIADIEGLHAIEVINGGCSVINDNTSIHYEQLLRRGRKIVPVGGDDNHDDIGRFIGWTMIKAQELSYDALMDAYEKGYCYASEGPEILNLYIENNKVCVKTSHAKRITLFSEGRYCDFVHDTDRAEFDFCPELFGKYFRIEVIDENGKRAYSNAYYTDKIYIGGRDA